MAKTEKTHKQRLTSFKEGICPYCGKDGATLTELQSTGARGVKGKDKHLESHAKGYRGACTNENCMAENFFTNKNAKGWIQE